MSSIPAGQAFIDSLAKSTAITPTSKSKSSSKEIGQDGFLKLLTTQLQTQDPTQPVDNTQMVAQMAQFSSVAGIAEMNTSLKSMASDVAAARFGDASGWIGRSALISSGTATALSSGGFAGQITLPSAASDVTLSLVDTAGNTAYSQDLGAKSQGSVDWGWDGKDSAGKAVAGPLKVIVTAAGANGGSLDVTNATWNEVQSVRSPTTGSTKLITPLGNYDPSDVIELG